MGRELDLSKLADMITSTLTKASEKVENQSDKMYDVGKDTMSSIGEGALEGAKSAAKDIEAAGDIITQKYNNVLSEINRSGKKKGDIQNLFATITQIKRSDLNSFNALKDELKDMKAVFTDIGDVKGLENILKQYGKTADKLRSIDFGFGSAFVAKGRANGSKNTKNVDETKQLEVSLEDVAKQSDKTTAVIQSNNTKQIKSLQELVNLLTEYKKLCSSVETAKLPQLYEYMDAIKDNLEVESEGTPSRQRKILLEEIRARYSNYQNEWEAYNNGGEYIDSNGRMFNVDSYDDLLRTEEYLKSLIALYIRCGGSIDKFSKKVKNFVEENDIVGALKDAEAEYDHLINEAHTKNIQRIDRINEIRDTLGYKEDGSNTSLTIGGALDSITHGGDIEEAANGLYKIYEAQKDIVSENESIVESQKQVSSAVDNSTKETEQRLNKTIQVQKEWISYLDKVLDDDNFKSSGKRDAATKLKARTQALMQQRTNPDDSRQYATEMTEVAWKKAYDEAERQGVAASTLARYRTDAGMNYEQNLSTLQKEKDLRTDLLAKTESELATIQRTTTAINAENAELSKQQKIVNSSEDIKKFQDEWGKVAKNYAPEDMSKRYGYLMEAISGENPTMSAVDALNELIAKEQELESEREASKAAAIARGKEMEAFNASFEEYSKTTFSSQFLTEEYSKIIRDISSGSMSAAEGIETLKSAIEKYNAGIEESVPAIQQQSEAEQSGVKAAEEAAEAHRKAAAAAEEEATANEKLAEQQKNYKYSLTDKDFNKLINGTGLKDVISYTDKSGQKILKQQSYDILDAVLNEDYETAQDILDHVMETIKDHIYDTADKETSYADLWDDYLKGMKVRIPMDKIGSYKSEFQDTWGTIRRKYNNRSNFQITTNGSASTPDVLYENIKANYPWAIPEEFKDANDEFTALKAILAIVEKAKAAAKEPKQTKIPLQDEEIEKVQNEFIDAITKGTMNADALRQTLNESADAEARLAENADHATNTMERQAGVAKDIDENIDEKQVTPIGNGLDEKSARDIISNSNKPTSSAAVFNDITDNTKLQEAFKSIINDIEQQSMTLVRSDIMDSIDKNGTGTLKFVSDDMNNILVQTWKMIDGQLTLASEKYSSIFKVDNTEGKQFDAEGYKRVAQAQAQTLRAQFKGFADDPNYSGILKDVENAANNIIDADSLKAFKIEINAAKESLKQLKAEMSSSKSLDPLAAAEKTISKLPIELDKIQTEYKSLKEFDSGDIIGAEGVNVESLIQSIRSGVEGFNDESKSISERLSSFKDILKSFDQLGALMSNLRAKSKESSDAFKPILTAYKELTKLQEDQKKTEVSGGTEEKKNSILEEINQKTQKLKELGVDINNINASDNLTTEQKNKLLEEQEKSAERIKKIEIDAANAKAQKERKQELNYGKGAYNSETRKKDSLVSSYNSIDKEYGASAEFTAAMDTYIKKYNDFEAARNKIANSKTNITKADKDAFNSAKLEVEKARKAVEDYTSSYSKLEQVQRDGSILDIKEIDSDKIQSTTDALKAYGNEISNGKINISGFNSSGTEMYGVIDQGKGVIEEVTIAIEKSSGVMYAYKTATKEVGTAWDQFKNSLSKKGKELATYLIGGGSFYKAINEVKKGIQYVKEIDLAMTELKKVTDETDATYAKFMKTASKTSSEIGTTMSEFINSAADFARLGYSIEESADLSKAANIYKNVGDGIDSVSAASESIISTMKAFGIEANNAMGIVDRFNEVGKILP